MLDIDTSRMSNEAKAKYPELPNDLHPVTKALGFVSMHHRIFEITRENYVRVYVRIRAYEEIFGALLVTHGDDGTLKDSPVTLEQVKDHIGLHTNAFPEISGDEYGAFLYAALRDRIYTKIRSGYATFAEGQAVTWPVEEHERTPAKSLKKTLDDDWDEEYDED